MTFSRKTFKTRNSHRQLSHQYLENTPGLLIDEAADPLDTTPSSKSPDCRLGDALLFKSTKMFNIKIFYLDVVPQHLAMSLGSSLAQALASFASSSHDAIAVMTVVCTVTDVGVIESSIFYQP